MTPAQTYYQNNRASRLEYQREYVKTNRERIYTAQKVRRDLLRREAIFKLGGACQDCGTLNPVVLQFHHRPGERKVKEVMALAGAPNKFWAEVAKCDLLCANCHLIRHAQEDNG